MTREMRPAPSRFWRDDRGLSIFLAALVAIIVVPALGPVGPPGRVLGDALVSLNAVNKHYGQLHVLKDINLNVRKGEVVVVIGPSGSGKSTLCRAINRLETIDDGVIKIDGKELPAEGKELAKLRAQDDS